MQKLLSFYLFVLVFIFSCHSPAKKPNGQNVKVEDSAQTFLPVTEYLKGQLKEVESMPVTPLKIISINGRSDSQWVKREDIRYFARPFLTPVIDSVSMSPYFSETSFLDETINAYTLSYDAKGKLPDSLNLNHWDVYVNPQKNTIKRIYMVKEITEKGISKTFQLTWMADYGCSIRTIIQKPGGQPEVKEEKMIWNFDN